LAQVARLTLLALGDVAGAVLLRPLCWGRVKEVASLRHHPPNGIWLGLRNGLNGGSISKMTAVLHKAFVILETLVQGPLATGQLASATGLNRSTVYRLLQYLETERYVMRDLLGRYLIGPRCAELTSGTITDPLHRETADVLANLQAVTGGDAWIFRAEGTDRIGIGACLGSDTPMQSGLQIGVRLAPSQCASALTLLAWSAERRLAARHLEVTSHLFRLIRRQGWVSSLTDDGIGALSAPIRDPNGEVVAAIAIFGKSSIGDPPDAAVIAPKVVAACRQISDALARNSP